MSLIRNPEICQITTQKQMLWTVSAGRAQLAGMLSSGYWALWSFHFTFYKMKENLCSCRQSMAQARGYNRLYFTVIIPSLKEDCLFLHLSFNYIYPRKSNPEPLRVTGFPSHAFCWSLCIITPTLRCFSVYPPFSLRYFTKIQALCRLSAALCPRTTLSKFLPTKSSGEIQREPVTMPLHPKCSLLSLVPCSSLSSKLSPVKFLLPEWKISGTNFHKVRVKWKQKKLTELDVLFWKPWPSM